MVQKRVMIENAACELCSVMLGYVDDKGNKSGFQWMYQKCDVTIQYAYTKLLLSQFLWNGFDQENYEKSVPAAQYMIRKLLKFSMEETMISNICLDICSVDVDELRTSPIFSDERLNLQCICELLVYNVLLNNYNACSRSFLLRLVDSFQIPYSQFLSLERSLLSSLSIAISSNAKDYDEMKQDAKKVNVKGKWWKIGAAAAAGSLLVLAAPALLPVASTMISSITAITAAVGGSTIITSALLSALSATSAFLASSAGLTVFSAGLLAGGAGYAGNKMNKRLSQDIQVEIIDVPERMNGAEMEQDAYDVLLVNGFLVEEMTTLQCWGCHPENPWMKNSFDGGHVYLVDWEPELLTKLTTLFRDMITDEITSTILSKYANKLLLGGTFVMTTPLLLLQPISLLDNTWALVRNRAEVIGKVISNQLLDSKQRQERPLTLVGYSLGCLVLTTIMKELATAGVDNLLQDVFLLGCPCSAEVTLWKSFRNVVQGRLVNGFSRNDAMLCYLHRVESGVFSVAGVGYVDVDGVENIDLSTIVQSHFDYGEDITLILQAVKFNTNSAYK